MISRDKLAIIDNVRYYIRVTLELDYSNDVWLVNIYYRRSTHDNWTKCNKGTSLYESFVSYIDVYWLDRVRRDYISSCWNVNIFEY